MTIRIVKEPEGAGPPYERCCFCWRPTQWWHAKKDVAVCPECASTHATPNIPKKQDWCKQTAGLDQMTDPTPTRDEAVRAASLTFHRRRDEGADPWDAMADAVDAAFASAPAPASGGVDAATPSARWRVEGKPDPHGSRFDVERAKLIGGDLTDDEVAHQTAMLMRSDLNFEAVLAVARDRIRWLSRQLEASLSPAATPVSEAEPVAWMDDGSTRAGTGTEFRVVTAHTKAGMPKAAAEAYTTPLYLAKPASSPAGGDDDIPTPIRIEDNLDIAMNEFWNAPGGTQGGVRAVLEWVNAVYFPKEGFVRVEHEHAGGAEP